MYHFSVQTPDAQAVLEQVRPYASDGAAYMMRWRVFREATSLDPTRIQRLSLQEIGFKGDASIPLLEVYARASQQGLGLCHPMVGPLAFLQQGACEGDKRVYLAMEPVGAIAGYPLLLCVKHGEISSVCGEKRSSWKSTDLFFFRVM